MINIQDPIARLLGPWSQELGVPAVLFRVILSIVFSAIIGCERSSKRHTAGLRTFMLVTLTGTLSMLLDIFLCSVFDAHLFLLSTASVISATIIASNSLFFSSRNQIRGITTSAAMWCCCLIGLAVGAGFYTITLLALVALLFCLSVMPSLEIYLKDRSNHFEVHLELTNSHYLQNFVTTIRKLGLKIDAIEMNPAYESSGLSVYSVAISISSQELKKYKTHKEIISALRTLEYVYHIEEI
ncbi:MAG: MgtC/SapB family protein [Treponemataceae bacterium]|nr:MgtC/SapB family protein [Treponemataceae bacterium]